MENKPFIFGVATSGDNFTDREKETLRLVLNFQHGVNTVLISPRRWGKTSLVQKACSLAQSDKLKIVYLDIFSCRSDRDFYDAFASAILKQTSSKLDEWLEHAKLFLSRISPKISMGTDPMTDFSISLEINPKSNNIDEILQLPEKIAQKKGYNIVVCIDEFQQIAEYPEKGAEALLRSYIQFVPNINFIFAGSKQHIMQQMFHSAKRPFYQSTQTQVIDRIARDEYYRFAADFFTRQGRKLAEETFGYLYDAFDGHTWYIQTLLNRLYGYAGNPDIGMVDYAIGEVVAESTYTYENLLAAYPASNIRLLKAIAKAGCVREINSGDFITEYRLRAASSVNSALKRLIDREMVYKTADGYIVYDRFMAIWLRQQPF